MIVIGLSSALFGLSLGILLTWLMVHNYKNRNGALTPDPRGRVVRPVVQPKTPLQIDWDSLAKMFAREVGKEITAALQKFAAHGPAVPQAGKPVVRTFSNVTDPADEDISFDIDESAVDAGVALGAVEKSDSSISLAEESVSTDKAIESVLSKLRAKRNK